MVKFSSVIDSFLENLKNENRASEFTVRNYRFYLKSFFEFGNESGFIDIELALIERFKNHLAKKNLKEITQNYYLIAIRTFLKFLKDKKITALDFESVKLLDARPAVLQIINSEEKRLILDGPDISKLKGLRDRAILEILFECGMKISEIVKLDVDANLELFWVNRYLSLRKDFFKPLFIRFSGKVQSDQNGEKMRLSIRSIERIVAKYSKIAGVIDKRILSL